MSDTPTQFDPSPDDPRIAGALAARSVLDDALRAGDVTAIEHLMAADLVVNTPLGTVARFDAVVARFRSGQIAYEDFDTHFDFVGVRGASVIFMGEEVARPTGHAPHAGKVVRRRFTDLWREAEAGWQLAARQATITAIE